jgi:hypothetical protein
VTSASNLAAAEAAAAAFVAHDTDLLAPYLDPEVSPPASSWATELKRDAAWGVGYLVEPCREVTTNWFACPFELHLLGSREVGVGPFATNQISVKVRDGKILSAENYKSWRTNGMATHVDSVLAWVKENDPKNADFLLKEEQAVTAAEWSSWTRLWQQSVAEYVAASNEAG